MIHIKRSSMTSGFALTQAHTASYWFTAQTTLAPLLKTWLYPAFFSRSQTGTYVEMGIGRVGTQRYLNFSKGGGRRRLNVPRFTSDSTTK